jgi:serine/threonine protein kinase
MQDRAIEPCPGREGEVVLTKRHSFFVTKTYTLRHRCLPLQTSSSPFRSGNPSTKSCPAIVGGGIQCLPMQLESLLGSILDQKYRIERQLGEGAMGAVFQAMHLGTTRPVALKVIVPQLAANQEFGQRFKREAEAAGRLNHPNVVNVTDFGVTQVAQCDLAYLVMEYLDGQSLADYLKENPRPTFNFTFEVLDQIALALDAAHAAGIVHRDLKPSNIWLEPNHRGGYNVKVLDFGIAKVTNPAGEGRADSADAIATMLMAPSEVGTSVATAFLEPVNPLATPSNLKTTAGTWLGTPAYMAPEQCTGIGVDGQTDVYSLAVIAYQMLCGRLPFQAEGFFQLIKMQMQTTPQSPREHDRTVPDALAEVVLSGLEKDPARRPPTAGTFAARLRAASEGELSLIRRSKDVFQTQPVFMPVLFACLSVTVVAMIPIQLAAAWAAHSKLAPEGALIAAWGVCFSLFMLFGFQLFKAASMLMLRRASDQGHFRSVGGPALRALVAGLWQLLRTQVLSMIDVRPSSWRMNILWPVVWAAEGRSGKDAIARSRQLCGTLPGAALSLAVRQYGPALIAPFALLAPLTLFFGSLLLVKEILAGSAIAWGLLLYSTSLGILYLNFSQAFSFLYWSALRCRNEGSEVPLPAAVRDDGRKSAARVLRPGTLIWAGLPAALLAMFVVGVIRSGATQPLDEASNDGRRTTLLRLIDGGLGVDQLTAKHETPLFEAVRRGDQDLVAELLKRGAKVDVKGRAGMTPILEAAAWGRNDLARVLLDHGAAIDAFNQAGRTPLIVATMRGNAALVQLLLERGANAEHADSDGKTAAAYAREEGYEELAALLSQNRK